MSDLVKVVTDVTFETLEKWSYMPSRFVSEHVARAVIVATLNALANESTTTPARFSYELDEGSQTLTVDVDLSHWLRERAKEIAG